MRIKVKAGAHSRFLCPLEIPLEADMPASFYLKEMHSGLLLPAQCEDYGGIKKMVFLLPFLDRGDELVFELVEGDAEEKVRIERKEDRLDILLSDVLLTSYHIASSFPRPFFYPLYGPDGIPVTRNYPMAEVEGESKDHKHHRSLWVAHGDVNGVDNWSEEEGHGRQLHREFLDVRNGVVKGRILEKLDWVDAEGRKVLEEEREISFYNLLSPLRIIDFRICFTATEGDVVFGDTKEGGILSIRVASEMEGSRGGRIENSYGGVGEKETWGKRAQWCDYSGIVKGKKLGIAVLDHPYNFRHPTYWHVRDYGLFTANPFGVSYFTGNPQNRGDFRLVKNGKLEFRYRLLIHKGDAKEAKVEEHFLNYSYPPEIEVEK